MALHTRPQAMRPRDPLFCPGSPIDECIGDSGSNAKLIAELQAVTLAVRLFGLDALPQVLRRPSPMPEGTPPAVALRAHDGRQGS